MSTEQRVTPECAEAERLAWQLIAAGGYPEYSYRLLAYALAAQGKSPATIRQVMAQAREEMAEPERSRTELDHYQTVKLELVPVNGT